MAHRAPPEPARLVAFLNMLSRTESSPEVQAAPPPLKEEVSEKEHELKLTSPALLIAPPPHVLLAACELPLLVRIKTDPEALTVAARTAPPPCPAWQRVAAVRAQRE